MGEPMQSRLVHAEGTFFIPDAGEERRRKGGAVGAAARQHVVLHAANTSNSEMGWRRGKRRRSIGPSKTSTQAREAGARANDGRDHNQDEAQHATHRELERAVRVDSLLVRKRGAVVQIQSAAGRILCE